MGRPPLKPATPTAVGENLRRLRREYGWSQHRLAAESGISRATVAAIELGRYRNTAGKTILKLAGAFGVEPAELYRGVELDEDDTPFLERFLGSRWESAVHADDNEIRWLRHLPLRFWRSIDPSAQAVAELLAWRRRNKL